MVQHDYPDLIFSCGFTDCFSAFFFQNKVLALMLLFDKVIKLCQRFETCHGTSLFTRTSCKWCPHIFLKKLPASPSANIIPWHCESVIFSSLLLSESYWNINGVPCRWHKIQHLLGTSLLMFIPRGCQENSHRPLGAPAGGEQPLAPTCTSPCRALAGLRQQPSWPHPAITAIALGGNIMELSLSEIKRFVLFYCTYKTNSAMASLSLCFEAISYWSSFHHFNPPPALRPHPIRAVLAVLG